MFFGRRSSGGRGEFELAGSHAGKRAIDFLEWDFVLTRPSDPPLPTELMLVRQGGKPRLRIAVNDGIHIQKQLTVLLLLPDTTRDRSRLTNGLPVVIEKRYALDRAEIVRMDLDHDTQTASVSLGATLWESGPIHSISFEFNERYSRVRTIQDRASEFPTEVADALARHRQLTRESAHLTTEALKAVRDLTRSLELTIDEYVPRTDPLPVLEAALGIGEPIESLSPEDVARDEPEIRRRESIQMRMQRIRGSSGSTFRKAVISAYGGRCAFCGLKLPSVRGEVASGVDACHILAWSDFDLDVVSNGICLCKLHHWAFDQQILVLEHNETGFHVRLSRRATDAYGDDPQTIERLLDAVGQIPDERLPAVSKRPNPDYIARLYSDVDPDA